MEIDEINYQSMFAHIDQLYLMQILLVIICAGVIGFERQTRDKPLGMRTSMLIALGTMLFVKSGIMMMASTGNAASADPTRVIGQVVTGIGFLGAGNIMTTGGLIRGLTTAATIWVQAAIGVLIACGYLVDAVIFTLVTIFVLYGVSYIEHKFNKIFRRRSRASSRSDGFIDK